MDTAKHDTAELNLSHLGLSLLCAVVALIGVNRMVDGPQGAAAWAVALGMAVVGVAVGAGNVWAMRRRG